MYWWFILQIYLCMWRQEVDTRYPQSLLIFLFDTGILLNLEHTNLASLAGGQTPEMLLSLPPQE